MSTSYVPCTRLGGLQINVVLPAGSVAPANDYRGRWRVMDNPNGEWTYFSRKSNPITLSQVPLCSLIEGYVQADCGDGNFGREIPFFAQGIADVCKLYRLTQSAQYNWRICNSSQGGSMMNSIGLGSQGATICAAANTITGGTFEDANQSCDG